MDNMLTLRQRKLLGILNGTNQYMKGRELATMLGVTDRTIRSDIQVLASSLEPYGSTIEAVKGRGYLLHTKDPDVIQSLTYNALSILSPEDRMRAISMKMIQSDIPLDLGELEDEMFVSQSTLQTDIQNIRNEYALSRPFIRLIRHKNTICFEDNEWKKRYVMNLIMTWDWNYNYEAGVTAANTPLPMPEMALLDHTLHDLFQNLDVHLTEHDYISFLCTIGIAAYRIREGHTIPDSKSTVGDDKIISPLAASVVASIRDILQKDLHILFSEEELHVLGYEFDCRNQFHPSLHLKPAIIETKKTTQAAGIPEEKNPAKDTLDNKTPEKEVLPDDLGDDLGTSLAIQPDRHVQELLGEIERDYGLAVGQNKVLLGDLSMTLFSQVNNPYHSGVRDEQMRSWIRRSYPVALDFAVSLYEKGMPYGARPVRQMDICEIAALLADGMVAGNTGRYIPKCALVSHYSLGGSHTLMVQLRILLNNRLEIQGPFSIYEAEHIADMHYDLILLTTKVKRFQHNCPVVTWSERHFKENLELINYYLDMIQYRHWFPAPDKGRPLFIASDRNPCSAAPAPATKSYAPPANAYALPHALPLSLYQLLRTDCFRVIEECPSISSAIHLITQDLESNGILAHSFEKAVLHRESRMTTANPAGFAIPHAMDATAAATGMYVLHIKKGMNWGNERVWWVLLLFFTGQEKLLLPQVYGRLMKAMNRAMQEGVAAHIISVNDFSEMLMAMEGI